MKKMLAMLMALMMVFALVGAVAEDAQTAQGLVVSETIELDRVMLPMLINMFVGGDEPIPGEVVNAALDMVENLEFVTAIGEDTVKTAVSLASNELFNCYLGVQEDGIVITSSLFPTKALVLSFEEAQAIMEQLSQQMAAELGIDLSQITEEQVQEVMAQVMQVLAALEPYGEDISTIAQSVMEKAQMTENTVILTVTTSDVKALLNLWIARLQQDEALLPYVEMLIAQAMPEDQQMSAQELLAALPAAVDQNIPDDVTVVTAALTQGDTGMTIGLDVASMAYMEIAATESEEGQTLSLVATFSADGTPVEDWTAFMQGVLTGEKDAGLFGLTFTVTADQNLTGRVYVTTGGQTIAVNLEAYAAEDGYVVKEGLDLGFGSNLVTSITRIGAGEAPVLGDISGLTKLSILSQDALEQIQADLSASLENLMMAAYQAMPEQMTVILSTLSGEDMDDVATVEETIEELTEDELEELQELAQ